MLVPQVDPTASPAPDVAPAKDKDAAGAHGRDEDEPDPYLVETSNILVDLISLTRRTAERARLPKS